MDLHHLEGSSVAEVGRRTGRTAGSVAGLPHRRLKALRAQLGESESP